jgi:spermidine/putrescine transport system ATP-binding protein
LLGPDDAVPDGHNALRGMIRDIVYLGSSTHVGVQLPGGETLTVEVANHDGPTSVPYPPGSTVQCVCAPDAVRVLRRSGASAATGDATVQPDDAVEAAPPRSATAAELRAEARSEA